MANEFDMFQYIANQLHSINKVVKFDDLIEDKDKFIFELNDFINANESKIKRYIHTNDENGLKRYLYQNIIDPIKKKNITQVKEVIQAIPEPAIEIKKRGRPAGSKNKSKVKEINLPIHSVNDQNFIDAIKDLLWYKQGLMASQIISHLDHDHSVTNLLYAKLHQYDGVFWKESKIIGRYGKPIFKWYPIDDRKGYFYKDKIRSITNIAELTGMNKVTLWKRIKSGMNHIEAINTPIDTKMVRNGKK